MIIQNHDVQLSSYQQFIKHHETHERMVQWNGNDRVEFDRQERQTTIKEEGDRSRSVNLDISEQGMKRFMDSIRRQAPSLTSKISTPYDNSMLEIDEDDALPPKLQMAKVLLEEFFGIKIEIIDMEEHAGGVGSAQKGNHTPRQEELEGWGIDYSYREVRYEKEAVHFSAAGTVTTEDGREIQFQAQLEMSKEQYEELTIEFKAGDALKDPLAVNLDGQGVRLTDEKIEFDLDADGEVDNISFLEEGSGFLVLDKNQNGVVDDGTELFGPETNHGFGELKAYDADRNEWIDENDAIYYDLKIWTRGEEGTDQLSTLEQNNIGAIYLGSSGTEFDLGEGRLRETGVYLNENNGVGFIQEVDLVIS